MAIVRATIRKDKYSFTVATGFFENYHIAYLTAAQSGHVVVQSCLQLLLGSVRSLVISVVGRYVKAHTVDMQRFFEQVLRFLNGRGRISVGA